MSAEILTEKRLAVLETKLDNLVEKIETLSNEVRNHINWDSEKYSEMDSKYSAKWVEKIAIALMISVITGIAVMIFELVIK